MMSEQQAVELEGVRRRRRRVQEASTEGPPKVEVVKDEGGVKEEKRRSGRVSVAQQRKEIFAKQLAAGHAIAGAMLKMPELVLSEAEADQLAESILALLDYYDVKVAKGAVLWGNFIATAAVVYGSRAPAILKRVKASKPAAQGPITDLGGIPVV